MRLRGDQPQPPPRSQAEAPRKPVPPARLELETRGDSYDDCRARAMEIASRYFGIGNEYHLRQVHLRQVSAQPVLASVITAGGRTDETVQHYVTSWVATFLPGRRSSSASNVPIAPGGILE